MPKDLMGMKKNNINPQKNGDNQPKYQQTQTELDEIEKSISQYQGMSEDDLQNQLKETVRQQKDAGQFDANALDAMYSQVSSMLNNQQKQKMRDIINKIKQQAKD